MTEPPWGVAQRAMEAATAGEPKMIADVVRQLDQVQRALDQAPELFADNAIAAFNRLCSKVTRRVDQLHQAGGFLDPAFSNLLDIELAKRYFDALRLWGVGADATPAAWVVLFRRYNDADVRSLPCAVAGVNAQVNFDLAFALVTTWEQLGHAADGSAQQHDCRIVNDVFTQEVRGLRRRYLADWHQRRVDGSFDDWFETVLVECGRAHAWQRAQRLWLVRDDPGLFERERSTMDNEAANAGRILLSPFFGPVR
jgi:hypothetical protein